MPVAAGNSDSRPDFPGWYLAPVQVVLAVFGALAIAASAVLAGMFLDDGEHGVRATSGAVDSTTQTPEPRPGTTWASAESSNSGRTVPSTVVGTTASATQASPTSFATATRSTAPAQAAATATSAPSGPTATPTATVAPPAPNLATNGGFEVGSLALPWGTGSYEPRSSIFWGAADADAEIVGDISHSGSKSLRIRNRSAAAPNVYRTVAQKVSVKGGAQHCLTWWARVQAGTPGMLTFRLNDSWSAAIGIGSGSTNWTQYAFTFTAEDSNIDLRIVSENSGTVWLDDIVLTEGACRVPNGGNSSGGAPR